MSTGEAGPAGREGQAGPAGREGIAGRTGPTGHEGKEGQEGPEGKEGTEGPPGPPGPVGAIVDLTAAQEDLAVAVRELITTQKDVGVSVKVLSLGVKRLVLGVVVAIAVILYFGVGLRAIANANKTNGDILVDCTTPTPSSTPENPHPKVSECYERGGRQTAAVVGELRRSTDCVALYINGERPPACEDVAERMDRIRAGENPFVTTTTTTITR